jgi:Domain of unknown function (DUF4926)
MPFELFSDVILTKDVPEEDLKAGDVGTVVERHVAADTLRGRHAQGDTAPYLDTRLRADRRRAAITPVQIR